MATIPTITEIDALRLDNLLLKAENAQLTTERQRMTFNEFARTLEQPGYVLQRLPDGTWAYQPQPAETGR
jgi:hypothetical protein